MQAGEPARNEVQPYAIIHVVQRVTLALNGMLPDLKGAAVQTQSTVPSASCQVAPWHPEAMLPERARNLQRACCLSCSLQTSNAFRTAPLNTVVSLCLHCS